MHSKPAKRSLLLLIALILILFAFVFAPIQKTFVFIDNDNDEIAAYLRMESPFFQIKYTHSIHLSDVLESYKALPDGTLKLVELQYKDFNIGMPSNAGEGETFVEKDGKYFIKNMDRELADFRLFVGDVDAGLSLISAGSEFDLKKTLERGKSYTFRVQRLSLFQQLEGVNLNEQ